MPLTRITYLDRNGTVTNPTDTAREAWAWVCDVIAANFDCLPEDVGCEEDPAGGPDLVTVNGEAVARVDNTPYKSMMRSVH